MDGTPRGDPLRFGQHFYLCTPDESVRKSLSLLSVFENVHVARNKAVVVVIIVNL